MTLTLPEDNNEFYSVFIMALCIWREARGESIPAKQAVAWVIRNRAAHPSWWGGPSIPSVVLKPYQFSSFNRNDPNSTKFPSPEDLSWVASLNAAQDVLTDKVPDPTGNAVFYFDKSLDSSPPSWATDGSTDWTVDIGSLHFYKRSNT